MAKSSYNFVPLANQVFFPDDTDKISQDIPFADGEDGVIELTIKNVTPIFTRNGAGKGVDEKMSSHIVMPDGSKRYFIPGTSIKGCLRSVMEILAHGKMQQYDNDSFGIPREFDTRKPDNKIYMSHMQNVSCGWLKMSEDDEFFISECTKGVVKISHDEIRAVYSGFNIGRDHHTAQEKQESMDKTALYPACTMEGVDYQIVCTGHMKGKKHEYLFSVEQHAPVKVENSVIKAFESVHKNTGYYGGKNGKGGFLKDRLHKGLTIPVFFTKENGKINSIGIARMFRPAYPNDVKKSVEHCYNGKVDYDKIDLPEAIFGYVRGNESLKGRVTISHAFCNEVIADANLLKVSGVLGQPSASYYPFYLKQDTPPYNTYNTGDAKIAGRKRYRITKGTDVLPLPVGNGNDKVGTELNMLPQGKTFKCSIVLHNMRPFEIGALISAITFNKTPGAHHNLGMAKAFGYGKVTCSLKMNGLQKSEEEYLRAFEVALASKNITLLNNEALNQLVSIASETHDVADMGYMDMAEYRDTKKVDNFTLLKEIKSVLHTILTQQELNDAKKKAQEEADEIARKNAERLAQEEKNLSTIAEANKYINSGDLNMTAGNKSEAKLAYTKALELLKGVGADTKEVEAKIDALSNSGSVGSGNDLSFKDMLNSNLQHIINPLKKWCRENSGKFGDAEYADLLEVVMTLEQSARRSSLGSKKDIVKAIGKCYTDKLYTEACIV